ncbi:MAG: CPBP family intramembrane glutamic endopeptidase [Pirellulales bacterium]
MIDALLVAETLPANGRELSAAGFVVMALFAASCAVWPWLVFKWRRGESPIPRAPRSDVPWHFPEVLFAIALVLTLAIASALFAPDSEKTVTADSLAFGMLESAAFYAGLAAMVAALLVFVRRANRRDLGIRLKLPGDFVYGGLGWLAALAPVYGLQIALVKLVASDRKPHPLIEMLIRDRRVDLLALAVISAVIIAPAVEEFLFRVLLQGWLEKHFSPQGVARIAPASPDGLPHEEAAPRPVDTTPAATLDATFGIAPPRLAPFTANDLPSNDPSNPFASPQSDLSEPRSTASPPHQAREINSLRRAAPIVISSVLFAAAHAGTWPDPVPLFVLALVLGYVYRQTHRLWPSVLLHMLFNGSSLAMVWFGAD